MEKRGSIAPDLSLISDISEASDTEASDYHSLSVPQCPSSFTYVQTTSPLISEASNCYGKPVRFNSAVAISSPAGEATDNEFTMGEDLTLITPTRSLSECLTCTLDEPYRPNLCDSTARTRSVANSCDVAPYYQSDSDSIRTDRSASFFRTSDHLPRLPLITHRCVSNVSNSTTDGRLSQGQRSDAIPRPIRSVQVSDLSKCNENAEVMATSSLSKSQIDLTEPSYHTTKLLAEDIAELSKRIERESLQAPSEGKRREAARLLSEAYNNSSNQDGAGGWQNPLYLNSALTVNIPQHVETFNNLVNLSVDESEIVRLERQRVVAQRRRMAQLRKQAASNKSEGPKPELLEFFDPNQHVFQSANLHMAGIPNMLPLLCRADDRSTQFVFDRLLSDHVRMWP